MFYGIWEPEFSEICRNVESHNLMENHFFMVWIFPVCFCALAVQTETSRRILPLLPIFGIRRDAYEMLLT